MKTRLLPAIVLALLMSSCARYQISTISSTSIPQTAEDGSFVMENDSVKIAYSFAGKNAPVSIYVYNKLNEPLYIDWQRSALVYNDSAISYVPEATHIVGDISGTTLNTSSGLGFNNSSINATASLPKYVEFIPPHAYIKHAPLMLATRLFKNIPDSMFHTVYSIPADVDDRRVRAKKAVFTASNTPLLFNSYLTIYGNGNASAKASVYKQTFYISELINTNTNPASLVFTPNVPAGSSFYVKQQTGYGKTMGTVGTIAAVSTILGAADALASPSNQSNNSK